MTAPVTGNRVDHRGERAVDILARLRMLILPGAASGFRLGTAAYLLALVGTLLLKDESWRGVGALMLAAGGLAALAAWRGIELPSAFPGARAIAPSQSYGRAVGL